MKWKTAGILAVWLLPALGMPLPAQESSAVTASQEDGAQETSPDATPPTENVQQAREVIQELNRQKAQKAEQERDHAEPLVDDREKLLPLDPKDPVWLTPDRKHVVTVGQICLREGLLEFFACRRGSKEHESIVSIDVKPYVIHAGLLAAGAEPGEPVQYHPEFKPPTGPEVEIEVRWKDEDDKLRKTRAQDWVYNKQLEKKMETPWVFSGSYFRETTDGRRVYLPDQTGEIIGVANFPTTLLDIPARSSDSNDMLLFQPLTEAIPPLGTDVTLILTPKVEEKETGEVKKPTSPSSEKE